MTRLFGTDGVRGKANKELTPKMAFDLGRAGAFYLSKGRTGSFFVIGKDTRLSGGMLEGALIAGINSVGGDVVRAGIITTPGTACLTKELGAAGGVMISASHNPFDDNGIKFFNSEGFKLDDAEEEAIEDLYFNSLQELPCPAGDCVGSEKGVENTAELYLSFLKKTVGTSFTGMRVVLDCANGAAYRLAPRLFRELGAQVEVISAEPDGKNINVSCGSTFPEAAARKVLEKEADVGFCFDGDADRLIAVDEKGRIVDGDALIYILGKYLKEQNILKKNTIVATVMSNMGLDAAARKNGIEILRSKVGDRYVLEAMREGGFSLGGEQSGHIIFLDYASTGDGILTALKLLEVMRCKNNPLSALCSGLSPYPQVLRNCRVINKEGWEKNEKIARVVESGRVSLKGKGRILVRPSGTEHIIRVMVEGRDEQLLHKILEELCRVILVEQGERG